MSTGNINTTFAELIAYIQSLVFARKTDPAIAPGTILYKKWEVVQHAKTDFGVSVTGSQSALFQKPHWDREAYEVLKLVDASAQLDAFRMLIPVAQGTAVGQRLSSAMFKIISMAFQGKSLDAPVLLDYFLKSLAYGPVPAWSDIDVYGVCVKDVPSVTIAIGNRRYIFRQLEISDFEHESDVFSPSDSRLGIPRPNSILRIELETWRPLELQVESAKAAVMLRLFSVCEARFGRQLWGTKSPFAIIAGSMQGGENLHGGSHPLVLASESAEKLQRFCTLIESRFPAELQEIVTRPITPLAIAYERYCDSLLASHPIERKIAFAIMGLEAIYLLETEVAELMYRLQMRVSKVLSKLDFPKDRLRLNLKAGYSIRNAYVHGGYLSDNDKRRFEKKGVITNELASNLLNYLRISMLHLIISGQSKKDFLALLEDSFIDRKRDDELQSSLESEKAAFNII